MLNPLFGVPNLLVADALGRDESGAAVFQSDFDAHCLSRATPGIEVIPDLSRQKKKTLTIEIAK